MLDDLVGDADRIAKDYAGIITLAHGRPDSPQCSGYA
jgi:hypothetical protein